MKLQLIDEWKAVLLRGWSMLAAYASALFGVLGEFHTDLVALLPTLADYTSAAGMRGLSFLFLVLVPVGRVFKQAKLRAEAELAAQIAKL